MLVLGASMTRRIATLNQIQYRFSLSDSPRNSGALHAITGLNTRESTRDRTIRTAVITDHADTERARWFSGNGHCNGESRGGDHAEDSGELHAEYSV